MKVVGKLGRYAPALLGAVLLTASVSAGGTPAMAFAPGGLPASVPMPGTGSSLRGVFCTSATNCWAVGSFRSATTGATLNQVLHWNGTNWSQDMTVPSKGGTAAGDFSELRAVRCRTASDCWAVGDYQTGGATLNQALHFNGTKWAVKPVAAPGGTASGDHNRLFDIVCPGASNCWAAGDYGNGSVNLNQLLHWNGSTWTLAKPLPQSAGTADAAFQQLNSVRCASVSSCLAVGTANTATDVGLFQNEALRWNGTKWSMLTIPSPGGTADGDFSALSSLACTSATNCWAAGVDGSHISGTSLNQMMHWDGTAWTQDIFIDQPDGTVPGSFNELHGITCRTASDCWAVGDFGGAALLNEAIHWDGSSWSPFPPPNPDGISPRSVNSLTMVRCTSETDCWAVGAVSSVRVNQIQHWNGTQWLAS